MMVVAALAVASPGVAHAQVTLQNDGFVDNQSVGFQAGFVAGEIGASRFDPPQPGVQVLSVQLLFGGAATTQTVTVHVWDDSNGVTNPGAELYSGDFQMTGSNTALQEIDLSAENIQVPGTFRVGIEFQHSGLPSIARDDDGNIQAGRNFIFASDNNWYGSAALGLAGDWIIRAIVTGTATTPDAGPGGAPDAGAGGGECTGNGDCIEGEYCDTNAGTCTFDCREDGDCGTDMACNSLGQCVAAEGGAGGCCDAGGAPPPFGAIGLGVVLGGLVVLRRRRRA